MEGRCTCGAVHYSLTAPSLFTHACHCTWCQRDSGSAFALNAMIETDHLVVRGEVEEIVTPTASGKGQIVARCPICKVALFSHYAGAGRKLAFVRVGTLENPADCPPDIHIFTTTKLPWVVLPNAARAVPEYYRRSEHWPPESLARWAKLQAG